MSRILIAWELGAGLGHVLRLLPLAKELQSRGHDVALCLQDFWRCASRLEDCSLPLLQAPIYQASVSGLPEPPLNFAEILHRFGYLDPDGLYSLVRGWHGLYQLFKPDLVIAEAAPTALLTANIGHIRAVAIGNGFFLPPRTINFPNMRPWLDVPSTRLQNSDAAALETVNHVRQKFGCLDYGRLTDLFDVPRLILSYPELDCYTRNDDALYLGDLQAEGGVVPSWPEGGKKVFVYLYAGYRFNAEILQRLAQSGASVLVYSGALDKIPAEAQTANIRYVRTPLDISRISMECDFAICHGGHGLVCDMLRAGKPLLLLPRHLEEFLLSAKVAAMGAGVLINHEDIQVDLNGTLQRLMADDALLINSAKAFAEKYRPLTHEIVKQRLADRCEKLATP